MKKNLNRLALYCLMLPMATLAQTAAPLPPPAPAPSSTAPGPAIPVRAIHGTATTSDDSPKLTKFDLNFPGGNPHQLVAAIEKAMERPLNVVIPEEYAEETIPALRMTQVTVPDLFRAMELASIKTEPYRTGSYFGAAGVPASFSYQQMKTSISFQTAGPVSDDSVWYFRGREKVPDLSGWEAKAAPARISRFYSLAPYLEQGYQVEDITTAVQTAWKMLGDKDNPNISFHKETKLLIAVGEPAKLETIDAVLEALKPKHIIDPRTGLPTSQSTGFSTRLQSIIDHAQTPEPPSSDPVPVKPKPAPKPAP